MYDSRARAMKRCQLNKLANCGLRPYIDFSPLCLPYPPIVYKAAIRSKLTFLKTGRFISNSRILSLLTGRRKLKTEIKPNRTVKPDDLFPVFCIASYIIIKQIEGLYCMATIKWLKGHQKSIVEQHERVSKINVEQHETDLQISWEVFRH
jgi:hypothetical protein